MEKIFNLTSTFKALREDDGGFISVVWQALLMLIVQAIQLAEAWTKGGLQNFEKNPIILFNHDYNKPIGTSHRT